MNMEKNKIQEEEVTCISLGHLRKGIHQQLLTVQSVFFYSTVQYLQIKKALSKKAADAVMCA